MQGTTEAAFQVTGSTPTGIAFAGDITFTTNRATLTVNLDGTLDLATGEFGASGDVAEATGKLAGATGTLTLAGVQDQLDPAGSFTETVSGEICVDLGGTARNNSPGGTDGRGCAALLTQCMYAVESSHERTPSKAQPDADVRLGHMPLSGCPDAAI